MRENATYFFTFIYLLFILNTYPKFRPYLITLMDLPCYYRCYYYCDYCGYYDAAVARYPFKQTKTKKGGGQA